MMPSEWAYEIAREQRRDVETMATNLDAARAQGRREGLEEAAVIAETGRYHSLTTIVGKVIATEIRACIEEPAAQDPKR